MRSTPKVRNAQVLTDQTIVTTTEKVVATLSGVMNQSADGPIRFIGFVAVLGGTNTTFATVRVRRGTDITGTVVGEGSPATLTGAANGVFGITCEDAPGEVAGVSYVLTVQLTAASANGSATFADLLCMS